MFSDKNDRVLYVEKLKSDITGRTPRSGSMRVRMMVLEGNPEEIAMLMALLRLRRKWRTQERGGSSGE